MITERVELQQDVSRPAGLAAKAVERLTGALAKLAAVNIDPNAAGAIKLIEDAANKLALTKRRQQTDEEKAVAAAKRAAASASREEAKAQREAGAAAKVAAAQAAAAAREEARALRDAEKAAKGLARATDKAAAKSSADAATKAARDEAKALREAEKAAKGLTRAREKEEKTAALAAKSAKGLGPRGGKARAPGDLGPALPRTLVPTLGGMATVAGGFILAKAAQVAADIAARIAQAFVDGAKAAFQAATFRQNTERGLAVVLKSASAAKAVYEQGIKLAAELGTGTKETLSGLQSLIARGFPVDDAVAFTRAMADLQVVNPAANVESLLYNIAKIKGQGKVQGDELNALAEAGLNLGQIFELVAKQSGKTVPEIQKMLAAGKLTADMALPAILASVEALTGKPLGRTAKEASVSLAGLAKRLENIGDLLYVADFDKASQNIEDFARPLLALIGPGTQTSDAVSKAITSLANALTGLLGGQEGAEKTAKAIEKMAAFGTGAAEGIRQIDWAIGKLKGTTEGLDVSTIEKIGTIVAWVVAIVVGAVAVVGFGIYAAFVQPFVMAYEAVTGWWTSIKAWFATATGEASAGGASIGSAIVSGLTAALTGGLSLVVEAAAQLVGGAVDAGRGPKGADAHSPSRKMIKLGGDMADGLPIGMERQLSAVRSSAAGMLSGLVNTAPPANQNGVGARGAGGGVVVHVHLDAGAVAAAGGPAAAEAMGARAGNAAAEAYIRRMREAS